MYNPPFIPPAGGRDEWGRASPLLQLRGKLRQILKDSMSFFIPDAGGPARRGLIPLKIGQRKNGELLGFERPLGMAGVWIDKVGIGFADAILRSCPMDILQAWAISRMVVG